MKRTPHQVLLAATLALVALAPSAVSATASRVWLVPATPGSRDSLVVHVAGSFPDRCSRPVASSPECALVEPDTLDVRVAIQYCNGASGCSCAQVPSSYEQVCSFGPLAAGRYVVRFTEEHVDPADPQATGTLSFPFTVTDATPTLVRTWGRLKAAYR